MWKQNGVIVSCQAHEDEPLHGPQYMAQMAIAAEQAGAIGVRACGVADIAYIKEHIDIPVIGILKKEYPGYIPIITPTLSDAFSVAYAGADVIAMDCTKHSRPDGQSLKETVQEIRRQTECKIMADIATFEEGKYAYEAGVDYLGTTLVGYTEETKNVKQPGFSLMNKLVKNLPLPVIAEGGLTLPEHVEKAFNIGVSWVVVGTAITRPKYIAEQFIKVIK